MDDEATTTTDQPATGSVAAPPAAPSRRRTSPSVLAIAILIGIVLAEAVLLFRGNTDERARTEVLQSATGFLSALTTYNSSSLTKQRDRVLSLATGKFRGEYDQLTGSGFLSTLQQTQADQVGKVLRAAVASVQGDTATVLAVVQTRTTNKDLKAPRIEENVIELSLVHTANGWKIDSVSILGSLTA